jgi:hypothetical protein
MVGLQLQLLHRHFESACEQAAATAIADLMNHKRLMIRQRQGVGLVFNPVRPRAGGTDKARAGTALMYLIRTQYERRI